MRSITTRCSVIMRPSPTNRTWADTTRTVVNPSAYNSTGRPLTYDVTHSDVVAFLDAHAVERFLLVGSPHVAAGIRLPPALEAFLDAEGRDNLDHPKPTAWTVADVLAALSWLTGHRIAGAACWLGGPPGVLRTAWSAAMDGRCRAGHTRFTSSGGST